MSNTIKNRSKRRINPKSLANLRVPPKGTTTNPGGRPKTAAFAEEVRVGGDGLRVPAKVKTEALRLKEDSICSLNPGKPVRRCLSRRRGGAVDLDVTTTRKSVKKGRGRPTKYQPEFDRQGAALCEYGADDKGLAKFFRVSESTVNLWKLKHPDFSESLKKAKAEFDARVERSLYELAIGYSHPDMDIRTVRIGRGRSKIVMTPFIKHYPPDVTACIFWLKNRRPRDWRDKVQVEDEETVKADPELISAAREVAAALLK